MARLGEARIPGGSVSGWMTKAPMGVSESTPIRAALAHMESAGVRHLLVMDDAVLTGIVSNRDLGRLVARDMGSPLLSEPVRSIMSEELVTVAPETPVLTVAQLLLDQRIGAVPIRDGDRIVGIFTVADALEALLAMVDRPGK